MFANNNKFKTKINDIDVESRHKQKLLGVILMINKSHISSLCKRASQKLNALTRKSIWIYLNEGLKSINNKINRTHERTLKIV